MRILPYRSMINWGNWSVKQIFSPGFDANSRHSSVCGKRSRNPYNRVNRSSLNDLFPNLLVGESIRRLFRRSDARPTLLCGARYMQFPGGDYPAPTLPTGARWARIARLMAVCGRQMRRTLADEAGVHNLNDAEFLLLWACRESGESDLSQNGLAASIGLSSSQLSGLVEGLRQRGLADVKRSRLDRRRQHWCLTQAGNRVLDEILTALGQFEVLLDAEFSPADQIGTLRLLERLARVSERSPRPSEAQESIPTVRERKAPKGAAA